VISSDILAQLQTIIGKMEKVQSKNMLFFQKKSRKFITPSQIWIHTLQIHMKCKANVLKNFCKWNLGDVYYDLRKKYESNHNFVNTSYNLLKISRKSFLNENQFA